MIEDVTTVDAEVVVHRGRQALEVPPRLVDELEPHLRVMSPAAEVKLVAAVLLWRVEQRG